MTLRPAPRPTPRRHRFALPCVGTLLLGVAAACTVEPQPLNAPRWLPAAMSTPLGEDFKIAYDDGDALHTLHALGFAKIAEGHYQRKVDLLPHGTLVPSAMDDLPEIDAIAVISIHRPFLGDKQYAYDTLRSLMAQLPAQAQINMLVGNANTDYLAHDVLVREIGQEDAQRVHITAAPQDVAQFFVDEAISTGPRAAWNYARALRSYAGSRHLLLMEDDVSLSAHGMAQLRKFLIEPPVSVFALFNDRCAAIEPTWSRPDSALTIGAKLIERNSDFPTLQAMVYASEVAHDAGDYLVTRAGRESHDYMLGRFFGQTRSTLGYVQPSIAQHEGRQTTGLSGPNSVPWSTCYEPELPPVTDGNQAL
jgi:hypothetical protein